MRFVGGGPDRRRCRIRPGPREHHDFDAGHRRSGQHDPWRYHTRYWNFDQSIRHPSNTDSWDNPGKPWHDAAGYGSDAEHDTRCHHSRNDDTRNDDPRDDNAGNDNDPWIHSKRNQSFYVSCRNAELVVAQRYAVDNQSEPVGNSEHDHPEFDAQYHPSFEYASARPVVAEFFKGELKAAMQAAFLFRPHVTRRCDTYHRLKCERREISISDPICDSRTVAMCLAIPGKILSDQDLGIARTGRVQFGGVVREVRLDLFPKPLSETTCWCMLGLPSARSMSKKPTALIWHSPKWGAWKMNFRPKMFPTTCQINDSQALSQSVGHNFTNNSFRNSPNEPCPKGDMLL